LRRKRETMHSEEHDSYCTDLHAVDYTVRSQSYHTTRMFCQS
jgi:hypothetical protein